jgi:hypothetical protein
MCFFPEADYVDLCKRYRRHVMDRGLFVSLREKIARQPLVRELIGTPHLRQHILRNYKPDSARYEPDNPSRHYHVSTFDERASQLRQLKAMGIERLYVCLAGWPYLGYDRQHPDGLPPAPDAGGWEGMRRFSETCQELGYLFILHDQFRDYYLDAPSYDAQFATHEEDAASPATAFPGTRFGDWKEDHLPLMNHWDGGSQTFLNARFALGHVVKNHRLMSDRGIRLQGSYLDVFGYVPPDEDFNPEHPQTRADCMIHRGRCFDWVRRNVGIVGTEAGCDWTIPHVDLSSSIGPGKCVAVPLFNLVYHDAVVTPYRRDQYLRGFLNGRVPNVRSESENDVDAVRRMCALHERVGLLEMTDHEFLDNDHSRERTTFADGTTVTVDWDSGTVETMPDLQQRA